MEPAFLDLPWQVQLSLASGYAAYLVAHAGNRTHHRPTDVVFSTVLFSLLATFAYNMLTAAGGPEYRLAMGAMAFAVTVGLAAAWRKWGRELAQRLMALLGVSYANDDPSALATLSTDTAHRVSQIAVRLDDGRWLRCDDASAFADSPFAPCLIGQNGDVALYVTHVDDADGEKKLASTKDADFGDRLTYVPASRIVQMNLRYLKSP